MAVAAGLFGAGGRYERLRLFGVADDGVAFDALRENRAIGIHDLAASSLQRHGGGAALRRGLRHAFAVDQLNIGKLDKAGGAHQRQNDADGHGFRQQVLVEERVDPADRVHRVLSPLAFA